MRVLWICGYIQTTSVQQIQPRGRGLEIRLWDQTVCVREIKKKTKREANVNKTYRLFLPYYGKRMSLLFAPADFGAAENEQRHQRMQVEQQRREMNVATNLAGLINKNNPPQWQTFLHMVRLYVNRLIHSSLPSAVRPRRLLPFPARPINSCYSASSPR